MKDLIKNEDKILIVAPHPDDESIGVGGFLSIYGKQCDVLFVTDGGYSVKSKSDSLEIKTKRIAESNKAMKLSKVNKTYHLDIHDRHVCEGTSVIKSFDISEYNYIFVPNRNEEHKDHAILHPVFKSMIKRQKSGAVLIEYEIWTPLSTVTNYLNIDKVLKKKKALIECYKSQLAELDFASKILSLNCYRGTDKKIGYAEAFHINNSSLNRRICYYIPRSFKYKVRSIIKKYKLHK